jgi:hypothetical protein
VGNRVKAPAPGPQGVPVVAAVRNALLAGLLTLLLAPWVGMAWEWIAPAPKYINISGAVFPADEDSSEFIAADGWFLLVALAVGLICGAIGYWRCGRALPVMLAITAAAYAGAWVARETGQHFGPPEIAQAAVGTSDGDQIYGAIDVRSRIVLLGWPIGVLIAYVSMILGLEKPTPRASAERSDGDGGEAEGLDDDSVEAGGSAGEGSSGNGRQPGKDGAFARQES